MEKFIKSCAATFLFLALPTSGYGRTLHGDRQPKHDSIGHADACLDLAEKQNGWAKIGNLVCVISDAKSLESKLDLGSMSGGEVFAGVSIVDPNGIPLRRVEVNFYQDALNRAEIFIDEWTGRAQTRHKVYSVSSPAHETAQGLLSTFKRAVEKSGAVQRLGQ